MPYLGMFLRRQRSPDLQWFNLQSVSFTVMLKDKLYFSFSPPSHAQPMSPRWWLVTGKLMDDHVRERWRVMLHYSKRSIYIYLWGQVQVFPGLYMVNKKGGLIIRGFPQPTSVPQGLRQTGTRPALQTPPRGQSPSHWPSQGILCHRSCDLRSSACCSPYTASQASVLCVAVDCLRKTHAASHW